MSRAKRWSSWTSSRAPPLKTKVQKGGVYSKFTNSLVCPCARLKNKRKWNSRDHMTACIKTRRDIICLLAARNCLRTSAALRVQMATDIERLVSFEEAYYDQYDYYNLLEYSGHAGGKGRSKREIELNTNRHCPAGHERKIAEKYHNSQMKRRRTKSSSSWWLFFCDVYR